MASLFCLLALDPPYHLLWVQLKLTAFLLPPKSPSLVSRLAKEGQGASETQRLPQPLEPWDLPSWEDP